jgi:hypothetical protein
MMAQRKDMMRIIRQDAGFSAKLGFGGTSALQRIEAPEVMRADVEAAAGLSAGLPAAPAAALNASQSLVEHVADANPGDVRAEVEVQKPTALPRAGQLASRSSEQVVPGSVTRGQVVYVSVSLTARQAAMAQAWATVARCTVQFLIRRVAQGLRADVFDDWDRHGMPTVDEPRGARGRHPTSVTLTLQPQFAADLAAKHDPLGMLGLGRAIGPAFRARFHEAFDQALAKANVQTTIEGDAQ